VKLFITFCTILILTSCRGVDEDWNVEEGDFEVPPSSRRNICAFDLSDVEEEFDFFGKWEFAGFQDINSKQFDQLTCMARYAEFALSGEDYDNVFQVTLEINDKTDQDICSESKGFYIKTFSFEYSGCVDITVEGVTFLIDSAATKYQPGPASHTLPMHEFEARFIENLQETRVYHLDNNKLYLYGMPGDQRMSFLALED
jgi:hypothetical protein